MDIKKDGPFNIIVNTIIGKCPEGNEFPKVPVPHGHTAIGEVDLSLRELGSQFMCNHRDASRTVNAIGEQVQKHTLTPQKFVDQIGTASAKTAAGMVLNKLFWMAVYSTLPDGNRWIGDFSMYQNWKIAAPANAATLLPDIAFSGSTAASNFFSTLLRICQGSHVYDDTLTFPAREFNEPLLGVVPSGPARQVHLMLIKYANVLKQHDPYPTIGGEVAAFKGKPFDEYAKWKHDADRLRQMVNLLTQLRTFSVIEAVDQDKFTELVREESEQQFISGFDIREDWEIVFLK